MTTTKSRGVPGKSGVKPLDLESVVKWLSSGSCSSVAILSGAGISCAAGIPDFRSPGGMYATLRPELLTATEEQKALMREDPTTVVSWDLFRENAFPYLEVRRPFILGVAEKKWVPTAGHYFARALADRGLLQRIYTQNIDGLDYGVLEGEEAEDLIVACHGSLATPVCEMCSHKADPTAFAKEVRTKIKNIYGDSNEGPLASSSTPITCANCAAAAVKPNTVLFGRNLPQRFHELAPTDMKTIDCLFVVGTSLQVFPAAGLVQMVRDDCVRILVNADPVGQDLGLKPLETGHDLFIQGDCDVTLLDLMTRLGWLHSTFQENPDRIAKLPQKSRANLQSALSKN